MLFAISQPILSALQIPNKLNKPVKFNHLLQNISLVTTSDIFFSLMQKKDASVTKMSTDASN